MTTTLTISKTLTALAAAALLPAGCGGSTGSGTATSTSGGAARIDRRPADVRPAGAAGPAGRRRHHQGRRGDADQRAAQAPRSASRSCVRVNSDAADQLHVHSTPEHTFDVEPKTGQSFQFTVDVPGKVDVELHQLNSTIATITVQ